MTKAQKLKDELVLAALVNAANSGKYHVRCGSFFADWGNSPIPTKADYPCCAVGAGVLYAGLDPQTLSPSNATKSFAKAYGVSHVYAVGVSDGFENCVGRTNCRHLAGSDFVRGFAVGRALWESLQEES